ncbi:MAG TPA: pyruvate kinase [Dehalococcoidia bacterium]|nr:pyruvate kinase [Dehalococcoidia bacterium]
MPTFAQQRRAKIICTLGPASDDPDTIRMLIQRGMNVARINMSHGTHERHRETVRLVREAAEHFGQPIAVIGDLQGPKIRTGTLEQGKVELQPSASFSLTTEPVVGDDHRVSINYPDIARDVGPGDRILVSDGMIELKVEEARPSEVATTVVHGGLLLDHQGVNLPDGASALSSLTEKDLVDLDFLLDLPVDYVALSFVRRAQDLRDLRWRMGQRGAKTPIIAKIEKRQALENLDEVLTMADALIVARGDLGVELPPEEVPLWQKRIVARAGQYLVPVITATQMLESMVQSPRPTRAEASDVANSVWEGADALMLSGETAIGGYPVEAVDMMDRIIRAAESLSTPDARPISPKVMEYSYDIARAARQIAEANHEVRAIVAFTQSGYTARLISKERPPVPILALTPSEDVRRRMALYWGVLARECRPLTSIDDMLVEVDHVARSHYALREGATVIIVGSLPVERQGMTNFLKLHRIGELD